MQLVNCAVKLGGKHYHELSRVNVSVPEYQLLLAIHGSDAINPETVKYAGVRAEAEDEPFSEIDYLRRVYGGKDEVLKLIDKLFPGANPRLPTTFAEIGLSEFASEEAVAAYEKRKAKAEADERDRQSKLARTRVRREAAVQALEEATEDEAELIKPPALKPKRKDALLG